MTGMEVLAIAIGEGLAMVGRLVTEWTKTENGEMTAARARDLASSIMSDVQLQEAIERRQFERKQTQQERELEQAVAGDDSQS